MAELPNPTQVSGKHHAIFEAYYKQIDPKGANAIEAMVAAKFLKKSGLSDVVLSRIWDLSDPIGGGFLDKEGFFVALKLVSLAQAGHDINMRNIFLETTNPPKVGDIPKIMPPKIQTVPPMHSDWSIKQEDRHKYEQLFDSLQPVDGLLPGNKVRSVLMDSKLPLDSLSKIWDLADQDKDGSLDSHEFLVAMHLVYQALEKKTIPSSLPVELQRPKPPPQPKNNGFTMDSGFVANFPKDIAPPPVPPLPAAIPPSSRVTPNIPSLSNISIISPPDLLSQPSGIDWVVTPADKSRFDAMFTKSDSDHDGLVSGVEIKDVFLQSGIPNLCLAKIWALCDTNQSGKLTSEQFALAMWLVDRKKNGMEPPDCLAPNMVPPSLRVVPNTARIDDIALLSDPTPAKLNPELEMISKEIQELAKERRILEHDVIQKEADIRIKNGEVRSLQSELDTLVATLIQLENQKREAQKRLDDLKTQVNKIRDQCQKQEDTIKEQETELDSKRGELKKLKEEETLLEKEYDANRNELENFTKQLQYTQLQICQVKAMVSQLQESQRQMSDALIMCKSAIDANNPGLVSEYSLKLEPDFREARTALENKEETKSDPFNDNTNAFSADQFKSNGYSSDPFGGNENNSTNFKTNFNTASSGFDDSFGSSFQTGTKDLFSAAPAKTSDPFGDNKEMEQSHTPDPSKDDFGSDPFAILHAPTSASQIISPNTNIHKSGPPPRPESPSPALPPKKAKQPPPRPAPPRPVQGPTKTEGHEPNTQSTGGFADFADFDSKSTNTRDFSEDPFKDYRYEDPFSIKDPFGDDDPADISSHIFSPPSNSIGNKTSSNNNISLKKSPTKPSTKIESNFANFDDQFTSNDFFATFNNNFDKNKTDTAVIDAFGDNNMLQKQSTNLITDINDVFNDNFEDEFAKIKISNNLVDNNISDSKAKTKEITPNFAKFDDFNNVNNRFDKHDNTLNKPKKKHDDNQKNADLFAADYSKTDTFDNDLHLVLQRSLVEQ